jgi:hypothetical protein
VTPSTSSSDARTRSDSSRRVRGDDPELAKPLRIEERELEAGDQGLTMAQATRSRYAHCTRPRFTPSVTLVRSSPCFRIFSQPNTPPSIHTLR